MTQPPDGNDDPGWRSSKSMLVPGLGVRRAQAEGSANALQMLRLLFTSFVTTLVLIGLVVLFIGGSVATGSGGPSPPLVAAGVVAFGLVSVVAPRLIERPLDCSSEVALLTGYRTRFFLRIAFAEAAALVGFVGVFLSGEAWMYPLGALFTAVGFIRVAPTSRNLERDQEALNLAGCGLSLTTLLVTGANTTHT